MGTPSPLGPPRGYYTRPYEPRIVYSRVLVQYSRIRYGTVYRTTVLHCTDRCALCEIEDYISRGSYCDSYSYCHSPEITTHDKVGSNGASTHPRLSSCHIELQDADGYMVDARRGPNRRISAHTNPKWASWAASQQWCLARLGSSSILAYSSTYMHINVDGCLIGASVSLQLQYGSHICTYILKP